MLSLVVDNFTMPLVLLHKSLCLSCFCLSLSLFALGLIRWPYCLLSETVSFRAHRAPGDKLTDRVWGRGDGLTGGRQTSGLKTVTHVGGGVEHDGQDEKLEIPADRKRREISNGIGRRGDNHEGTTINSNDQHS